MRVAKLKSPPPGEKAAGSGTFFSAALNDTPTSSSPTPQKQGLREEADTYPRVVAIVNSRWRVIRCRDDIQFILQHRRGSRDGAPTWRGRRFHVDECALAKSVSELCGSPFALLDAAPGICRGGAR